MHRRLLTIVPFLAFAQANTLPSRLRITSHHQQQSPLKDYNTQQPLHQPSESLSTNSTTLEVTGWNIFGFPAYTTPIAVGSPPQPFRLWLALDYGGLVVRSTACDDYLECGYGAELGFSYNASASTTSQDLNETFWLRLPGHNAYGNVTRDEAMLNNFELKNVTLGAIDEFYGENFGLMFLADVADGALGLAPPNATADLKYTKQPCPNILSHLLDQAPLEHDMLSFTLPRALDGEELGSIVLGGLPNGDEDGTIDLSIPFGDPKDGWNVPSEWLKLGDGSDNDASIDLSEMSLVPELTNGLHLPHNLTKTLYAHLHALPTNRWMDVWEFNCSYRHTLPTLTFTFPSASSHTDRDSPKVSFEEEDYTLHGYFGDDEVCLLTILEHEQPWLEDKILLGTMLWEKWHVVFDLREQGERGSNGKLELIPRERMDGRGEVNMAEFVGARSGRWTR